MPTDGDIIYLIKKYINDSDASNAANQVLTRRKHLQPLWKSVPEFTTLFPPPKERNSSILKAIYQSFCGSIQEVINETFPSGHDFLVLDPTQIKKTEHLLKNIKISIENSQNGLNHISLNKLLSVTNSCELYYFFVYVPSDAPKNELINKFKDVYSSCLKDYTNPQYNPA